MNEIQIDKNIPVPLTVKKTHWPFGTMEIGDSFFIPDRTLEIVVRTAITHFKKRSTIPMTFCVLKVVENEVKGLRCWRIHPKDEAKGRVM